MWPRPSKMASQKSGKGPRGGDNRKRDAWSGPRDYKSGSSSPGTRRSGYNRSDSPREYHRDNYQRTCAQYLWNEWRKVEQDLRKESPKDQNITHTVEYIEKNPTDIKEDELFDMTQYLKSWREKASSGE